MDGHVANVERGAHLRRALIDLLRARRLALHVSKTDLSIEPQIRSLLAFLCPVPDRQAVLQQFELDALFPPAALARATSAGCGVLYMVDGTTTIGQGVTWQQ